MFLTELDRGETSACNQLKFASSHCVTLLSNNKTQVAADTDATVSQFDDIRAAADDCSRLLFALTPRLSPLASVKMRVFSA